MIRFRDIYERGKEPQAGPLQPEAVTESIHRAPPPKETERTEVMRRPKPAPEDPGRNTPRARSKRIGPGISREVSRALEEILEEEGLLGPPPDEKKEWEISLDEVLEKYPVPEPEKLRTESLDADQVESLREILTDEDEG